MSNESIYQSLLEFLKNKFPTYTFLPAPAESFLTTASFGDKNLWTEFRIQIQNARLCLETIVTLSVRRRAGVAEAVIEENFINGCMSFHSFSDVTCEVEKCLEGNRNENIDEWNLCLSLKGDVPLYDDIANDLHDFSEHLVTAAKKVNNQIQFVVHSAANKSFQNDTVWCRLRVVMRYRNSSFFHVELTRDENRPYISFCEVIGDFQYAVHEYLNFQKKLTRVLLTTAHNWEQQNRKDHFMTWLHFAKGREWIICANPLPDKNEETADSLCTALKNAGSDIRLFDRKITLTEEKWTKIEISFCLSNLKRLYVTVERSSEQERPSYCVSTFLMDLTFSSHAEAFNTPMSTINDSLKEWVDQYVLKNKV